MNSMAEQLERAFAGRTPGEDEYLNEADGLIYCAKCNTPRQKRLSVMGATIAPSVLCRCGKERRDREEAARRQREFEEHVARLKAEGLRDAALRECTFANDLGYNPEIGKAKIYVEHWQDMYDCGAGLLLWGDVGTGKTFIAGCVANALLERGVPVLMTNLGRVLNALGAKRSEERNGFIDGLNRYSLLIIDDLGMERGSEYALEQVFTVVDSRYRSKKPLIVTTNLTLDELKSPGDIARRRIYDRVLERCVPVRVNRGNIRALNARDRMARMKALFEGEGES